MFEKRRESGQALVEYALVLPLFVMLLCAIIDCGWIGYQYISFDYSYRQASWELKVDDTAEKGKSLTLTGSDAEKPIVDNMASTALGINRKELSVTNPEIYLWSEIKTEKNPGVSKGEYEISSMYWRYMRIKAKLYYQVHPLTPVGKTLFGGTLTYSKVLEKERLLSLTNT